MLNDNKIAKIFIMGGTIYAKNLGVAAITASTVDTLKKSIPNSNIVIPHFFLDTKLHSFHSRCTVYYKSDVKIVEEKCISVFLLPFHLFAFTLYAILYRCFNLKINILKNDILREYADADVIIQLSFGDAFHYGGLDTGIKWFVAYIFMVYQNLLGILLKKPIVFYPQTIGPFETKITRFLARFILNRVSAIVVRERISKDYLQEIDVTKPPIYFTGDMAFLLQPAPYERVQEILLNENISEKNGPLIGISLRVISAESKDSYIRLMMQVVDYLVDKLNANVVFIPHTSNGGRDIQNIIFNKIKNKDKVTSITNEYTVEELKGIIGRCKLFIGAYMHANISAISTNVPTIALSYSHKYLGIMELVGQEKYVCDFRTVTFDELVSKINDAWYNREKIKNELATKVEVLKESAFTNGKLVKDLLNNA